MILDEKTIIAMIYQVVSLLLVILIQSYFYKGKKFTYLNKKKIMITIPVSIVIFTMYLFNISDLLTLFIIVLTLSVMYVGIKNAFIIYFFLMLGNMIFKPNYLLLLAYFVMVIITHFILLKISDYRKRLLMSFFLSFIFLNLELYLSNINRDEYFIYNTACFVFWSVIIHLTLYYNKRNNSINMKKQALFIDEKTNTNNYCCLLEHSYLLLKNTKFNISLILINIDRLKDINKLYGIQCGDKVIQIVAASIKENTETYGYVYRLAGDTFCVVSINEKFKMMQTITERIRLEIEIKNLIIDNNKINLSVSIGGYYGKIDSRNIDDYIEVAQDSLINSKYNGRNRVILNNHMVYYPKII